MKKVGMKAFKFGSREKVDRGKENIFAEEGEDEK